MNEKDHYVRLLGSLSSTEQHEKLVEMLDYYDVFGIRDLTTEQVKAYYEKEVGMNDKQRSIE